MVRRRRNTLTAAIYFHPDAYSVTGPTLMGRRAAGASFLRGFLQLARTSEFWVRVDDPDHGRVFATAAATAGRSEAVNVLQATAMERLAEVGTLHLPDPQLDKQAWQRAWFGHRQWSLTGVSHTTASRETIEAIANMLTAPVQPWDALVCTSAAVKTHVQRVLQARREHLQDRLGITRMVLPQLPVIPLGIHSREFAFTPDQRAMARQRIGAEAATLVVCYVGRLSFHAKAHPLAMYQAIERAARTLPAGRHVMLVECGWHANDAIAKAFAAAALAACPSVRVITLDGRKAEDRQAAWAGADVFCSLSDNIQESFGIAPVEAMAAGLPVVVSDWDGYRDTVRDGIDGYLVPTLMPQAGLGGDLAAAYAVGSQSYDRYCGYTSMMVAVEIEAAAAAFERLFASPDLRRQMGEAGRRRAQRPMIGRRSSRAMKNCGPCWERIANPRLPTRKRRHHPGLPGWTRLRHFPVTRPAPSPGKQCSPLPTPTWRRPSHA